jgi:pilus assembly protein CpaF
MRPDRVVIGEVRGAELSTLLQALNNGHRGSGATLHAASPELLVQRLLLLGMLAGLSPELTARLVAGGVDYLLQLEIIAGKRQLVAISKPLLRGDTLELLPMTLTRTKEAA